MFRYRIRSVVVAGIACTFMAWTIPARSQEEVIEEVPLEETIPGDPDLSAAITTETPDIPTDELALLVKPLTLEELEIEAAAWLLLLKGKQQEISDAEIAIKRQNLAIDKQEEAVSALEAAQQALEEAEEAQAAATPGSPEAEEAAKRVEEAKEELQKAQEASEEAAEIQEDLQEDEALQEALEQAEAAGELDAAKELLEETRSQREEMEAGSSEYEAITEKIDALNSAIADVEEAKEDLEGTVPDTPEHEEALAALEAAEEALKQAQEAISGPSEPEEEEGNEQGGATESDAAEVSALLENTEIDADGDTDVAGPAEVAQTEENLEEQGEQLEEAAEQLEEAAEEEADLKNQLVATVTELQSQRTAIVDRFKVILDEMDKKGGDTESYRKYIDAVSGIELDVSDTEGLTVRLISWAKSEEGGLRWVRNAGVFVGIVVAAAIVSQIAGIILKQAFKRVSGMSSLLSDFIVMVVKRGGILVGVLLGLSALAVPLGPILALLGGASFVLAFALQSNIGNFASGLMLMVYKPFDVGDEVKIGGVWGFVDSITLGGTKINGFR